MIVKKSKEQYKKKFFVWLKPLVYIAYTILTYGVNNDQLQWCKHDQLQHEVLTMTNSNMRCKQWPTSTWGVNNDQLQYEV